MKQEEEIENEYEQEKETEERNRATDHLIQVMIPQLNNQHIRVDCQATTRER